MYLIDKSDVDEQHLLNCSVIEAQVAMMQPEQNPNL